MIHDVYRPRRSLEPTLLNIDEGWDMAAVKQLQQGSHLSSASSCDLMQLIPDEWSH
jgi:hypothetical protein